MGVGLGGWLQSQIAFTMMRILARPLFASQIFFCCTDQLYVLCKCWSCTISVIHAASFHMHKNTHAHTKQCMSKPIGGGHADYSKSAWHCGERNRFCTNKSLCFKAPKPSSFQGFCGNEAQSQIFTCSIAQGQSVCADTSKTVGACRRLCH